MEEKSVTFKSQLVSTVIDGGYCVGCGACASLENTPMTIELDSYSKLQAKAVAPISKSFDLKMLAVCPFSGISKDEDQIGKELYPQSLHNSKTGFYLKNYAGYVTEDGFRDRGSSGGMGSWMIKTLLTRGLIDGVLHVKDRVPSNDDKRLFTYSLSRTEEEINEGAKSKYYPIELSEMLTLLKALSGRFAVVGIPCFIKSIRLLASQDPILNSKIKFTIGLICGHLKSTSFAEMFAWQCGIKPKDIISIDFRTKLEHFGANQYGVTVRGKINDEVVTRISPPVNELFGTNWGHGFFKYKACDFCDDVLAETADITIGDAWLPQFVKESRGTNVLVIRNLEILKIVEDEISKGRLMLEEIGVDQVILSQNSGLNHRREGLAYRLLITDKAKVWRPKKRVGPKMLVSNKVAKIQRMRMVLAEQSHIAFKNAVDNDSFSKFTELMEPLVMYYDKLYKPSILRLLARRIKNLIIR